MDNVMEGSLIVPSCKFTSDFCSVLGFNHALSRNVTIQVVTLNNAVHLEGILILLGWIWEGFKRVRRVRDR